MTTVNLKLILEAAIFAAPEPLTLDKMAVLFPGNEAPEKSDLLNTIESLQEDYKDRGVQLVKVASGYRFQAKSEFSQWLQRLWQQLMTLLHIFLVVLRCVKKLCVTY